MVALDEGSARSGQRKNAVLGGENTVSRSKKSTQQTYMIIWDISLVNWLSQTRKRIQRQTSRIQDVDTPFWRKQDEMFHEETRYSFEWHENKSLIRTREFKKILFFSDKYFVPLNIYFNNHRIQHISKTIFQQTMISSPENFGLKWTFIIFCRAFNFCRRGMLTIWLSPVLVRWYQIWQNPPLSSNGGLKAKCVFIMFK